MIDFSFISALMKSGAVVSYGTETLLIGYGSFQKSCYLHELDLKNPAFYFPDFFLSDSHPWIQFSHWREVKIKDLQLELVKNLEQVAKIKWLESPHHHHFRQAFKELQDKFVHSKLTKVVPYIFVYADAQMDAIRLSHSLIKALDYIQNYPGYMYGMWNAREGVLGITPELLFQSNRSKHLRTVALAGTCTQQCCLQDFKNNPKELKEHLIVVEGIKKSLESFGSLEIGEVEVLSLPTLNHLMTPIEVQLIDPIDFESLVKVLHPTPALGGWPKDEGFYWLRKYDEPIQRGRYGAPAGCFYPQKELTHCVVSIRNVQWDTQKLRIGAGCGLVKESQYEKEWNEIHLKIKAICQMLSL